MDETYNSIENLGVFNSMAFCLFSKKLKGNQQTEISESYFTQKFLLKSLKTDLSIT